MKKISPPLMAKPAKKPGSSTSQIGLERRDRLIDLRTICWMTMFPRRLLSLNRTGPVTPSKEVLSRAWMKACSHVLSLKKEITKLAFYQWQTQYFKTDLGNNGKMQKNILLGHILLLCSLPSLYHTKFHKKDTHKKLHFQQSCQCANSAPGSY